MNETYGVYFQDRFTGKYIVMVVHRDKGYRLGSYETENQAKRIMDKELKEIYCNA